MTKVKANQFVLPHNEEAARDRLTALHKQILAHKGDADLYARLVAAQAAYTLANDEAAEISTNMEAIRKADYQRLVDSIDITAIRDPEPGSGPLRSFLVEGTAAGGYPLRTSIASADRVVLAALARKSELIPVHILAFDADPLEALLKYTQHKRRGFVSG